VPKFDFGWGSAPDPAGELRALPRPLAGAEGLAAPFPKSSQAGQVSN